MNCAQCYAMSLASDDPWILSQALTANDKRTNSTLPTQSFSVCIVFLVHSSSPALDIVSWIHLCPYPPPPSLSPSTSTSASVQVCVCVCASPHSSFLFIFLSLSQASILMTLRMPGFCTNVSLISSVISVQPPRSIPGPIFSFLFCIALIISSLACLDFRLILCACMKYRSASTSASPRASSVLSGWTRVKFRTSGGCESLCSALMSGVVSTRCSVPSGCGSIVDRYRWRSCWISRGSVG